MNNDARTTDNTWTMSYVYLGNITYWSFTRSIYYIRTFTLYLNCASSLDQSDHNNNKRLVVASSTFPSPIPQQHQQEQQGTPPPLSPSNANTHTVNKFTTMAAFFSGEHDGGAVVVDIGSGTTKIGWAGDDQPRSYFRSVRTGVELEY
jgi:Actin